MSAVYSPQVSDFLPKTRRGHGSMHPSARFDRKTGRQVREATVCVNPTCHNILGYDKNGKARGELHQDPASNLKDWKDEHGFGGKEFKEYSFEDCVRAGRR